MTKTEKPAPKPAVSEKPAPTAGQSDAEKIDLTPDTDQNKVSEPGPTVFAVDPDRPVRPDSKDAEHENTPLEEVGPTPGKNLSAERIVQVWDGGERIIACNMAKDATKANREKAIAARPALQRYLAGDTAG